ncbi:hypothetical protein ACLBKU_12490 [Erythrobacter sp. NE805]|uniref:hypothetical protein n=1 Tax=Erythrobacter sp. NE805 TaxID=3389875 RepID=UPI00396B35B3
MKRIAVLAPALLLAACGEQASAPAEQGGEASGEILQGSVSDAMIPLDQLTSEAPLAPRQVDPAASDNLDAEQPVVDPALGPEGVPASEGAAPQPAVPVAAPTG